MFLWLVLLVLVFAAPLLTLLLSALFYARERSQP
jgi:hypothetical protein